MADKKNLNEEKKELLNDEELANVNGGATNLQFVAPTSPYANANTDVLANNTNWQNTLSPIQPGLKDGIIKSK